MPVGRVLLVLGGLALGAALSAGLAAGPAAAQEQEGTTAERVSAGERFGTAANIATATFDQAAVAILATGEDFPDALTASFAAGAVEGPILLTAGDQVPDATWQALEELAVETVVLIGGIGAISDGVEQQLEAEGYLVERVAGADRFATAVQVATRFGPEIDIGWVDGDRVAILASGTQFADALSAGPLAAAAKLPLFLTERDAPNELVTLALEDLRIRRIIVVGGESAVSEEVVAYYEQDYEVERMSGPTRTATAATVAENLVQRFGIFSNERVLLARGDAFPDALAASVHAASLGAPILLTATPNVLSRDTSSWLASQCPEIGLVRAVGGGAAVRSQTLASAVSAAETCLADPEVVSSFTTPLTPGQARNTNIHLAADYIDGTVIAPGTTFSLNQGIGPRTTARGFVANGFIDGDGDLISAVGGGVSQMATTFVNAAWFAGIDILQHRPHTIYFQRYPMCREATIIWGSLDVVVRNDSPYDIRISTSYTNSSVTVSLVSIPWAEVESWTGQPYNVEGVGGAFSVNCGRTIRYPDGSSTSESYSWRYREGYPG